MSDALRMGLMGAATGFLQGMLFNWQDMQAEAKSERLRQARMLEQQQLAEIERDHRKEEKLDDRAYTEKQDSAKYERSVKEQQRQEGVAAERENASREFAAQNTASSQAFTAEQNRLNRDSLEKRMTGTDETVIYRMSDGSMQQVPATDPPPEGSTGIEYSTGGRFAPTPARVRQAPTAKGGSPASTSSSVPGSSQTNPIPISGPEEVAKQPPGTWLRLPNGLVRQR